MAFGKKKKDVVDNCAYDLDSHCDKPNYQAHETTDTASGSISDIADHLLIAELEFRGYVVSKK